ncbi:MAG: response regulator transcription factor [Acidobacteria bacterium]|nr:response regulator transcription factor [Acidobacteriota bacterium]
MTLRVLIVDDEPSAREWLRLQVAKDPDVTVVGECEDGFKAVVAVENLKPDLVFLDVQMPGLDGFGVLETLGPERIPAVVFVTAYDAFAVKAFDVSAVDYILKPFGEERVLAALRKVRSHLAPRELSGLRENLSAVLEKLRVARGYPKWLLVKKDKKSVFLKIADIDWVESSRNNVVLHAGKEGYPYRETTQTMEALLDPNRFLRIHRSTIVNLERVKELEPWFNGDWIVTLRDETRLTMSASYRHRLDALKRLQ